ncbi:hypothetical protein EV363DRAFT_1419258 [Boletus edulis]|nr:hypothetical protein EV363DRAFT_1419258 [Boletus edulis]
MGGWGPSVRRGTLGGLSTCLLVRRAPLSEDWGRATGPLRACFSSKPVMIPYLNNRYTDLLVVFGQVGNVAVYPSRLSSTCHRDAGILVGDSGGQGRTDYTAAMVEGELERQTERSDVQLIRATIALVENIARLTTQVQGVKKRYLGSNCMLLDRWFYYHEIGAHGSCACTSDLYILTPLHDVGAVDEGSHVQPLLPFPALSRILTWGVVSDPSSDFVQGGLSAKHAKASVLLGEAVAVACGSDGGCNGPQSRPRGQARAFVTVHLIMPVQTMCRRRRLLSFRYRIRWVRSAS